MESDGHAPPFWAQQLAAPRRRPRSSSLLNPVVLILGIPILILTVLFFLLPPFLSHTNQILRPNSVKKSWDSLNILLVLFAVLCGVFARRNEDSQPPEDDRRSAESVAVAPPLVNRPRQFGLAWLDFPDPKEYNMISSSANSGGGRLRRSSSSYPDLRQETLWEGGGSRSKFSDDFEVNFYRSPPRENFDSRPRRRHWAGREEEAETIVREVTVDKFEVSSAPPPPTPPKSAPPPPPPPPPTMRKRRSVHSVPRKEPRNEGEISGNRRTAPPPAPPPPPPPPPPDPTPMFQFPEVKHERLHRRKSGATKDIATAIAALYKSGQRKREKRTKSRDIYDSAPQNSSPPSIAEARSTPPTPPPPPPPPSKVFQNLFKKSSKSKRVHSVPTTRQTPPPPPPPPPSILNTMLKNDSKSRRFKNSPLHPPPPAQDVPPRARGMPPKPTKPITRYHEETTIAPPSPLIPLPPPPPPLPFRMPEFKYIARGDLVRIRSEHSSRCSSPDLEDVDVMSVKTDGGDSVGPSSVTCPSPDVNVKADTFIARLRDEWRLEKMNSMKEKRKLR